MSASITLDWQRAEWRAEVDDWIAQSLNALGLSISGEIDQFHVRAWSTVMRVPTGQGDVYFKAGGPNQAFEPALLKLLHHNHPDISLPVLAADEARGWLLLPDGGPTLRQSGEGAISQKVWKTILARFAQMQIELASQSENLLAAGVPDHRLPTLPNFYDLLLADSDLLLLDEEDGLSRRELEELKFMKAELVRLCGELNEFDLPASLDHGDLHDANVFGRGDTFVFFDWGDASITHPFISLMIPLRVLADKLDYSDEDDARLDWARHAYLEPWTDFAPMADLQAAWELAHHVGKFQRAITWHTVCTQFAPEALGEFKEYFPAWLQEFLYHGRTFPK